MSHPLITFFAIILFNLPFSIPNSLAATTWQSVGPFGGSVVDIAIDPTNSQTVYAATDDAVYKSENGGASWVNVTNGTTIKLISSLAVDPVNSHSIYSGTESGLFKSINGGVTWTAVNSGMPDKTSLSRGLVVDPKNSQTIYVGSYYNGVFKSTNGAASWVAVNSGIPIDTNGDLPTVDSLVIDPSNSQIIYAGTDSGIFKSTNEGKTWTAVNSGMTGGSVFALTVDPNNSQILYAGTLFGLYKSTNGGTSWSLVTTAYDMIRLRVNALAIVPGNSKTVYAGTGRGVYMSTDAGTTWTAVNDGMTDKEFDKEVNALVIDPGNSQTFYIGSSTSDLGTIFKSVNGGALWSSVNNGIMNMNVKSLVIHPKDTMIVYAGTARRGIFKTINGGVSWTASNNGMSSLWSESVYSLAIDPTNSQIIYAGSSNSVYKSADGGASWEWLMNGMVAALAIDPDASKTIYAGVNIEILDATTTGGIFKSVNGGISWAAADSGLMNKNVETLAIDPNNSQTIYAGTYYTWPMSVIIGTYSGGVFKSTNGGASWLAVNTGLTNTSVSSIVIDPANSQIIYAGTPGGVFKSTNSGTSWLAVNVGLSAAAVTSLAIDPTNSLVLYAGTANGVFKTNNAGATWRLINNEIKSSTSFIAIDPSNSQTVYAATESSVFKLRSSNKVPFFTGPATTTFSEGTPGFYNLATSGWPAPVFSLSGTVPNGISFDTNNGTFTGTPASGTAGTYPLIVTASNGIPPDAVKEITLVVIPPSSLSVTITSPITGANPSSLVSVTGTVSGSGLAKTELQITDGFLYLQSNGIFSSTPAWITAGGTASWSFNTASVAWRQGTLYTIYARAVNTNGYIGKAVTSTFSISGAKTATILSLAVSPDNLRAGSTTVISGLLSKTDATAVVGQPISLIITQPSTSAVPNPAPITQSFTTDNNGTFTSGTVSRFTSPGTYLIQARFDGTTALATAFASEVLPVVPQSGYAIIVTGKATDNSLLEMHTASTGAIYSTLVNKRGFLPDNVLRLTSTTSYAVTRQELNEAITIWAKGKLIAAPGPLYLIMIDHGSPTGFLLGNDTITPADLKGYLDTLETEPALTSSFSTYDRTIIIGSCYSGIFAPALSKTGRVIITSANSDEQSIAGFSIYNSTTGTTINGGEYFIDNLFNYLGRGDALRDAFTQARDMVELRDPRKVPAARHADSYDTLAQHPLVDDTGTGSSYTLQGTAGTRIANRQFGVGIRTLGSPTDIIAVTETTSIATTQTSETPLWLKVNDNSRIAKAWLEIRTPTTNTSSSTTGQVIPKLITKQLFYDGIQWNSSYTFPNEGKYTILYYTQDNQTNDIAPAKNSVVYKQLANNIAPRTFTLTTPANEQAVNDIFPLTWQNVTSTNKITYTLQVATDPNFTNTIYKEENIPQPATYMPKDAIKDPKTGKQYCNANDYTFCYWKVTAIDNYGAATDSNTQSFTILLTNALPAIITGYIRNETNGAPIAKATIGTGATNTSSYINGAYLIITNPGSYTLTARAQGYTEKQTTITATAGKVATNNIVMQSNGMAISEPGDCDNDSTVTIAEVQSAVNMFLGLKPVQACVDTDVTGVISIAEVQKVINSFLGL